MFRPQLNDVDLSGCIATGLSIIDPTIIDPGLHMSGYGADRVKDFAVLSTEFYYSAHVSQTHALHYSRCGLDQFTVQPIGTT